MIDTTSSDTAEDKFKTLQHFAQRILDFDAGQKTVRRSKYHNTHLEYLTDLENIAWNKKIRLRTPQLTGVPLEDISLIVIFCTNLIDMLERRRLLHPYGLDDGLISSHTVQRPLVWEQEHTDLQMIQGMINRQREIIQTSVTIPESQQLRLLKRLERFQSALHISTPGFKWSDLFKDDV